MPSPRRRAKIRKDRLSPDEMLYLLSGTGGGHMDLRAAESAWREFRDEVEAVDRPGLIPWAAVKFDGAIGRWSYYQHLRGPQGSGDLAGLVTTDPEPFYPNE